MIKIERDEGLVDYLHLSLRFGFEDELLSGQLSKKLAENGVVHEIRPPSKWSSDYKVNIRDLESATFDGEVVKSIINMLGILPDQYDFFLGITSAYQL